MSTAFFLGLDDDQIRILGRWKDISTSQYYRNLDHSTLLNIFSKLSLNPEVQHNKPQSLNFASFSDRLIGLPQCCQHTIFSAYQNHSCQPEVSTSNEVSASTSSSNIASQSSTLTWLVKSGWVWTPNPN